MVEPYLRISLRISVIQEGPAPLHGEESTELLVRILPGEMGPDLANCKEALDLKLAETC